MKKGLESPEMLFGVLALFIVILLLAAGPFKDYTSVIFGIKYAVDTSTSESCAGYYDKDIDGIPTKDLLTDEDNDRLFDNICDTAICRDGYDGRLCKLLSDGISFKEPIEIQFRQKLGMKTVPDEGLITQTELPMCKKNKATAKLEQCSTNNKYDTDNDYLPDIVDIRPETNENGPKCYEGTIKSKEGVVIGYSHQELFESLDQYHCVMALCTDRVALFDGLKYFKKYCKQSDVFKIENAEIVSVSTEEYSKIFVDYR